VILILFFHVLIELELDMDEEESNKSRRNKKKKQAGRGGLWRETKEEEHVFIFFLKPIPNGPFLVRWGGFLSLMGTLCVCVCLCEFSC
jgi:hypothetical protein